MNAKGKPFLFMLALLFLWRICLFPFWHYLGNEPKLRPLCTHLSFEMSSRCIISSSYLRIGVGLQRTHVSSSFTGLFSCWPTCLSATLNSTIIKKIKSKGGNIHALSTACQRTLGEYKLLQVGTNRLAVFKRLSWFGFDTLWLRYQGFSILRPSLVGLWWRMLLDIQY